MNRDRRRSISTIIKQLTELKEELESIKDEENESFENIPENLQNSERYEAAAEANENLSEGFDSLEACIYCLQESIV